MDDKFVKACDWLIEKDDNRNEMFEGIDDMSHCDWAFPDDVPEEISRHVHKVISTDPRDALVTGQRHLASSIPQFSIAHLSADKQHVEDTDMMELAVAQLYNLASKRKMGGLTDTIAWEAIRYGMVAGQVMFLPREKAARKTFGGDPLGLRLAEHYGPFAVEVYNAKDVHVQYSSWGPEMVLLHKLMRTREVLQTFGNNATEIEKAFEETSCEWCTIFDLHEVGKRSLGVVLHTDEDKEDSPQNAIPIYENADTGLDFLPWFFQLSGTTTESSPEHQIIPMLKPLYDSGAWKTLCILNSLTMTKVIGLHYAATIGIEGAAEVPEIVGTLETPIVHIPFGGKLIPIDVRSLDTGMLTLADQMRSSIDKATVPRQIQTGEFPSGTPMGAVSIITETGMQALAPYRNVAAKAIADIAWLMFAHIKAWKKKVLVKAVGEGNMVTLDPKNFDLDELYIDVSLQPKQPIDIVARLNAAQMYEQLGGSKRRALEIANEVDPLKSMQERQREELDTLIFGGEMGNIQAMYQANQQQILMGAEMQMQAMAQQAQGAQGQGFNPAEGGTSPVRAGEPVREEVTGMTQEGIPL